MPTFRAARPSRAGHAVIATSILALAAAAAHTAGYQLAPDSEPLHAATLAALLLAVATGGCAFQRWRDGRLLDAIEYSRADLAYRAMKTGAEMAGMVAQQIVDVRIELTKLHEKFDAGKVEAYFAGYLDRAKGRPPAEEYLQAAGDDFQLPPLPPLN